jgi:hypothetical protein
MNSFCVSISSDNSPAKLQLEIASDSPLRKEGYEVALAEISFPRSAISFGDSICYVREMFRTVQKEDFKIKIPGISVTSIESLLYYVNSIIIPEFDFKENLGAEKSVPPKIRYDNSRDMFIMETGYGQRAPFYVLEFEGDLKNLFGFEEYSNVLNLSDFNSFINDDDMVSYHGELTRWGDVPKSSRTKEWVPTIEKKIFDKIHDNFLNYQSHV